DDLQALKSALDAQPTLRRPTLKGLASGTGLDGEGAPPPPKNSVTEHLPHLRRILPSTSDCVTLLSLPMSLKTGSLRVNVDQLGPDIGDFADRAMRLRCCTEKEAWRLSISPLYCGALLRMQVVIYVLRHLADHPTAYPHLRIVEVFRDTDRVAGNENRDEHIGIRIAVSFEAEEICPLQWEA
ncbi:unnamed protein product, partial [Symbiodinium sp. CCMP2456]